MQLETVSVIEHKNLTYFLISGQGKVQHFGAPDGKCNGN